MNISARPRKQDCCPNGELANFSRVPASFQSWQWHRQSCMGRAGVCQGVLLSGWWPHPSGVGRSRGRQGAHREMGSHLEGLVLKYSPLHREGIEKIISC